MHLLHSLPSFLAQADANYNTYQQQGFSPVAFLTTQILAAVIAGVLLFGVFKKAGLPGWGGFIPIYNTYLLCKAAGKPGWWLILLLIPFVNFVIYILLCIGLAKCFNRGGGTVVGLIFLPFIFLPILGFGSARWVGPNGAGSLTGGTYPTV